jgi:uroporphyrinogen decarboxylase
VADESGTGRGGLNGKELVRLALAHKETDIVPYSLGFTFEARDRLIEHYGADKWQEMVGGHLVVPVANLAHGHKPEGHTGETYTDEFGITWGGTLLRDRGQPLFDLLAEPTLSGYEFPDPHNPLRFEHFSEMLADNADSYILGALGNGELFERAYFLRGFDNFLMDLRLQPSFAHELLDRVTDYNLTTIDILEERFELDGYMLGDDYGSQKGMIMSPELWRTFFRPRLARIFDRCHKGNRIVALHSDGDISAIIPDLIEIGLDVLNPVQPETMDVGWLKREYGADLTFFGGIPTQRVLPDGTPDDVRREVHGKLELLGRGGGYIASTGVSVVAGVPKENLVALVEALRNQEPGA